MSAQERPKYNRHTPPQCPKPYTGYPGLLGWSFPFVTFISLFCIWYFGFALKFTAAPIPK
jgi:hypothetical protein